MKSLHLDVVLYRLENYQIMVRQIDLLRYEMQHVGQISSTEMIEVMTFQKNETNSVNVYAKNVPEIAASYQSVAAQLNEEAINSLASKLADLCQEQDRLLHYIGLLDRRQQEVIRRYYFEQQTWCEIADSMGSTARTVQRLRQQAVKELATLYDFAEGILRVNN